METSIFYYSFLHGIIAIKRRLPERRRHIIRAKTAISEIDAQIEKLREKRRGIVAKANERFARAAAKAGLTEMDIPDNELDAIFEEIAARFRAGGKKPSGVSA